MKVKLIRSIGSKLCTALEIQNPLEDLQEKKEADVQPSAAAQKLVDLKLAEVRDSATVHAISKAPQIADAKK